MLSVVGHSLLRLGGPGPMRSPEDEVTLLTQGPQGHAEGVGTERV